MDTYLAGVIWAVVAVGAGILAAFAYSIHFQRKQLQARRRIPNRWPLAMRSMVNSREHLVWHWLMRSFYDHVVMIKLPVTRYTRPEVQTEGQQWFDQLSGVYCTFSICTTEGQVIAGVDVAPQNGGSLRNLRLKHKLLTQCGLRYGVVDPEHLPDMEEIRTALLGEQAAIRSELARLRTDDAFKQTRDSLKAAVSRRRSRHPGEAGHPDFKRDPHHLAPFDDSHPPSGWKNEDSFIAPLDSRFSELH